MTRQLLKVPQRRAGQKNPRTYWLITSQSSQSFLFPASLVHPHCPHCSRFQAFTDPLMSWFYSVIWQKKANLTKQQIVLHSLSWQNQLGGSGLDRVSSRRQKPQDFLINQYMTITKAQVPQLNTSWAMSPPKPLHHHQAKDMEQLTIVEDRSTNFRCC